MIDLVVIISLTRILSIIIFSNSSVLEEPCHCEKDAVKLVSDEAISFLGLRSLFRAKRRNLTFEIASLPSVARNDDADHSFLAMTALP